MLTKFFQLYKKLFTTLLTAMAAALFLVLCTACSSNNIIDNNAAKNNDITDNNAVKDNNITDNNAAKDNNITDNNAAKDNDITDNNAVKDNNITDNDTAKDNNMAKKNVPLKSGYELNIKDAGAVSFGYSSEICTTEDGFYMISQDYKHDKKHNSKIFTNYFVSCPFSGDKTISKKKIKGLGKKETIVSFFKDNKDNLFIITKIYSYNKKKDSHNYKFYLLNMDKYGNTSNRIKLKPDKEQYICADGNNAVYKDNTLFTYAGSYIHIFNKNGKEYKTIRVGHDADGIFMAGNGKIYIIMRGPAEDVYDAIYGVNIKTGRLDKPLGYKFCLKTGISGKQVNNRKCLLDFILNAKPFNNSIYIYNFDCMFEYSFEKKCLEILFNLADIGVDHYNILDFHITKDGSINIITYKDIKSKNDLSNIEIVNITRKEYPGDKARTILTMAVSGLESMVKNEIIKFNRTNKDYCVEIIDYNVYGPIDADEQLHLDIMAGKIPDIIETTDYTEEPYISKNIITDLYPLMENDTEVKKEDFIDSICSTMEYNQKLYYMPISFNIKGFLGSKKDFGNLEGWSYNDMIEKYNNMPEGKVFIPALVREWFIDNILCANIEDFINYETKESDFDSEEFINMLKFSKHFLTEDEYLDKYTEYSNYSDISEDGTSVSKLLKNNRLLLKKLYWDSFGEFLYDYKLYKNCGGFTVISPPSKDRNNKIGISEAAYGDCYCISEKCSDKAGAWDFLKSFYKYGFQKNVDKYDGFPVRKDVLNEKMEHYLKTKKQKDIFYSVIDRIGKNKMYYDSFIDIIYSGTKDFYKGKKTAKQTAKKLQKKFKTLYG